MKVTRRLNFYKRQDISRAGSKKEIEHYKFVVNADQNAISMQTNAENLTNGPVLHRGQSMLMQHFGADQSGVASSMMVPPDDLLNNKEDSVIHKQQEVEKAVKKSQTLLTETIVNRCAELLTRIYDLTEENEDMKSQLAERKVELDIKD